MKIKRKGKKVHPSPAPSSTAANLSSTTAHDSLSTLNILPAAILTLITALTLQDREVLAYMITRSLKTTTTTTFSINSSAAPVHKPPVFDCDCFECYTSFWYRWDTSPNREVIHQAIEAFEEHLANGELEMKRCNNRKSKKKDKVIEKEEAVVDPPNLVVENGPVAENEVKTQSFEDVEADERVVVKGVSLAEGHKGFARKVFLDVLGVFNSRLWNLWGPNV